MMLSLFSFSSCCDENALVTDDNNSNANDTTATADYTFILWAVAGGTDLQASSDLIDILRYRQSGEIGDNVNFVGRIKTSGDTKAPGLQNLLKTYGYDGTITFDIGKKTDCQLPDIPYFFYASQLAYKITGEQEKKQRLTELTAEGYKTFFDNTISKKTGGLDYPFNNVDSLAAFIKNAAASHPAKNYVLVIDGHGNGFDINRDFATRATLGDYDVEGASTMSVEDISKAVKQSGVHIQTLVNHSCEMAALENIPFFQQIADYTFMSSEVTAGFYLQEIVANFSKAGNDVEKMKEAGRKSVDTCIEHLEILGTLKASSMGFYDLSKTQNLMAVTKSAADWFSDAAGKDPEFITKVLSKSICSQDFEEYAIARDSLIHNKYNAPANMTPEETRSYLQNMIFTSGKTVTSGFVLSHIMYQTLNMKSQATSTLNFNTLQGILDDYMQTLKDMAYIKAVNEDTSIKDYNYIFTSPSVCIVPLNSLYNKTRTWDQIIYEVSVNKNDAPLNQFSESLRNALKNGNEAEFQKLIFDNCVSYLTNVPYTQLLQNYKSLPFDQQTGWSNFLQKLNFIPTYATVPTRVYTLNNK